MFKFGVIDPAKVVRTALEDAASIAGPADHHRSDGRPTGPPRRVQAPVAACPTMGGMGGMM